MALAIVRTHPEPAALADQLAEAERDAVRPRNRVQELQSALSAAIATAEFSEAERLKGELGEARQVLAVREATVTALRLAAETIERQQADDAQAIDQARQQADAQRMLSDAMAAEKTALQQLQENLSQAWAFIGAAQDAFKAAQKSEEAGLAARRQQAAARALAAGEPGPGATPPKPNAASVLIEQDPLIRALAAWRR